MSKVYKRSNGNWYVDYVEFDGSRKRISLGDHVKTKKEAEKRLRSILGRIDERKFGLPTKESQISFEDYSLHYIEESKEFNAKRTVETNRRRLKRPLQFFKNMTLSSIAKVDIRKYKKLRKKEVSGSTVNRDLSIMKRIFNEAVEDELIFENPVSNVPYYEEAMKRIDVPLVKDEWIEAVVNCTDKQYVKLIFWIAYHTGMRRNEICNVTWFDVKLKDRYINVRVTKNQETRTACINDDLLEILSKAKRYGEYVISTEDGKRIKYMKNSWKNAISRAMEKYPEMNIKAFSLHDLRHTFASNLAMEGVDPSTIQKLGGWKSLKMVDRYVDPSREHLLNSVNKLCKKHRKQNVPCEFPSNMRTARK